MADLLDHVWEAIGHERELRKDLATYLQNVHLRRVERDDEYERQLREDIDQAQQAVETAIATRKREFADA